MLYRTTVLVKKMEDKKNSPVPFVLAARIRLLSGSLSFNSPPLGEAGGVLVALVHPLLPGPLHLLYSPRSPPSPAVIASKM